MAVNKLGGALRMGHWPTLLGAWLHLTVSFMVWLLFGALAVAIGEELQLSATERSVLVALPLLGGALLRIIAGWACDWYGAKRTGLLVLGLQLIAVSWAVVGGNSYGEVLGIGVVLGAGGASFAVAMPVASRAYPTAHQGLVLGLVASGNIGTVLILFLAPRWESVLGWHGACGLMLPPLLLTIALFASVVRHEPLARSIPGGAWWRAAIEMMRIPSVYWLCLMYGITYIDRVNVSTASWFHRGALWIDGELDSSVGRICGRPAGWAACAGGGVRSPRPDEHAYGAAS